MRELIRHILKEETEEIDQKDMKLKNIIAMTRLDLNGFFSN